MIDKSLRQYQQLVKKGNGNKRPGYRGDDWGGPSYGGSSSKSSSGGNGSHDRGGGQHRAAAQKAAPAKAPEPDRRSIALANQYVEPVIAPKDEPKIDVGFQEALKKQKIAQPKIDTGPKIDVGFQEILRKKQIEKDLRQKQQDPNFGQFFRPQPVVEQPSGIMGTVKEKSTDYAKKMVRNKIMKELGLSTLNPFLGVGSWLLDKFAPGKKAALKSNITNLLTSKSDDLVGTPDWQGEQKRKKTFHEGKGDGDKQQVTTVQEAVAGKGLAEGQKMLGIDEIKKRHSLLQTTLNDGYYVDNKGRNIQLNDQQKAMLTDYISQIDKYLVNIDTRTMSAHGGRIDKALGGRVRDI